MWFLSPGPNPTLAAAAVGAAWQEPGRAGIPALTSHYLYLICFDSWSMDGHSVSQRSTARNRKHEKIKPKIKIGLFHI